MQTTKWVALLFVLLLGGRAHNAYSHDQPNAGGAESPVPPTVGRWPVSAVLHEDMGRIRTMLEELRHYEMGHMSQAMMVDRVNLIEDASHHLFAHCDQAPEPDAALHRMLVPLITAAQKLKADPADMAEVQAMRQAVADYPRYFDDPSWTVDTVPMGQAAGTH